MNATVLASVVLLFVIGCALVAYKVIAMGPIAELQREHDELWLLLVEGTTVFHATPDHVDRQLAAVLRDDAPMPDYMLDSLIGIARCDICRSPILHQQRCFTLVDQAVCVACYQKARRCALSRYHLVLQWLFHSRVIDSDMMAYIYRLLARLHTTDIGFYGSDGGVLSCVAKHLHRDLNGHDDMARYMSLVYCRKPPSPDIFPDAPSSYTLRARILAFWLDQYRAEFTACYRCPLPSSCDISIHPHAVVRFAWGSKHIGTSAMDIFQDRTCIVYPVGDNASYYPSSIFPLIDGLHLMYSLQVSSNTH